MSPADPAEKRAKIVATLGPATDSPEVVEALLRAGVDVVRLNFSHGTHAEHGQRIRWVRDAAKRLGKAVAVLQDLQGPKIRTGTLVGGQPVRLEEGREVVITTDTVEGTAARLSTSYAALARDVRPGDPVYLSDGRMRLRVLETTATEVRCRVEQGGLLHERQGINIPGTPVSAPPITPKDMEDLAYGLEQGVDYVALSFVRSAEDLRHGKSVIRRLGHDTPLIAKIERREAVDDLGAVLAECDGVIVARGDMGVELGVERVPAIQKVVTHAARRRGIPVIVAAHMLESMTEQPLPTRAEASDVANAVWDGADALLLSGETATGKDPVNVVRTMTRIIAEAEATARDLGQADIPFAPARDDAEAISRAAKTLAEELRVRAVLGLTRTGRTAQLLSASRPQAPIHAFTLEEKVYRRLALWWGVHPVHSVAFEDTEEMVRHLEQRMKETGAAASGDAILIVGAMPLQRGVHTNFVKVHRVA